MSDNQWARWERAMQGHRIETERGNPPSGYFMHHTKKPEPQHLEAICVYRDDDGKLQCIRNVFGDGSRMDADQIEELLASCCFYPISYEIYVAVTEDGAAWPPEYATRLTLKEQAAGVAWTPALGRSKLGLDLKAPVDKVADNSGLVADDKVQPERIAPLQNALQIMPENMHALGSESQSHASPDWDNHINAYRVKVERAPTKDAALSVFEEFDINGLPRADRVRMETMLDTVTARFDAREAAKEPAKATIGHNEPPESIADDQAAHEVAADAKEPTADEKLAAEYTALATGCKTWLEGIGGKPRNKAEADKIGDYATSFGRIKKSAEDQHKVEKAPFLEEGRLIDAKWFKTRDNAEAARKSSLGLGNKWIDEENARRAEEARKVNEEAAALAAKHAEQFDAPITAPPPVEPEKVTGIGTMRTVSQRARDVWVVSDPAAFCAYLCGLDNPPADLLETLGKLANKLGASIKAGVVKDIPGITKEQTRSAA